VTSRRVEDIIHESVRQVLDGLCVVAAADWDWTSRSDKMAWTKITNWVSRGYVVFFVLLFVFFSHLVVLLILNSQLLKFSSQRLELSGRVSRLDSTSVAPGDLANAPESFGLSLRAEAPYVMVERLKNTKAWSTLEEKTAAYARRMELMGEQIRLADGQFGRVEARVLLWTPLVEGFCLLSVFGGLACLIVMIRRDSAAQGK
jgi:hypothetical protein